MKFGQKLKQARTRAQLSQEALAQKISVSRQTISNWENGRSYPDIGSLIQQSDLYGITLDELLKEDSAVQTHFQQQLARRKNYCQIAIELGIVLQLLGSVLLGREFPGFGSLCSLVGLALTCTAMGIHLRLFDHTQKQIFCGLGGLILDIVLLLGVRLQPALGESLALAPLRLLAIGLIWYSGVWSTTWKSPRLWLLILLYVTFPLFSFASYLQDTGSLNTDNPFGHQYRIEAVLYPEDAPIPGSTVLDLQLIVSEHKLRIAENGMDFEDLGFLSYAEPAPNQTAAGIWQLIPKDNPDALYRVTVEADSTITLSYAEREQLQYKWRLSPVDTAWATVSTLGSTMSTRPKWYPAGAADPNPAFTHTDVLGKATLNFNVDGLETITLVEEYHHGDALEINTYSFPPEDARTLKLETRYEEDGQYALYRIPYAGGEYRFILTFGSLFW